jgi:hypothetical protein
MSDIYIIFKTLRIKDIGGMMPPNVNIKGSIGEWYYGKITDKNILWDIREYYPMVIDEDTYKGLDYYNTTQITEDSTNGDIILRDLTEEELTLKNIAIKTLKKLDIRSSIESDVGDIYDIVADLSKQINILEKIVYESLNELFKTDIIPQSIKDKYLSLLTLNVTNINDDNIKDITDLENKTDIISKITNRKNIIYNIKKEKYNI